MAAAGRGVVKNLVKSAGPTAGKRLMTMTSSSIDAMPPSLVKVMAARLIEGDPSKQKLALPTSILIAGAGIYVGGKMAEKGAAFLEENEIFVPEDDDDD